MTDAPFAQYADGSRQLCTALDGLTEADLDLAPAEGCWTIRQIVHHVVDGDDLWKNCIKAALGNAQGIFTLQWYWDVPQDVWAEKWNYARRAIEPSLALLEANRRIIVEMLSEIPAALDKSVLVRWRDKDGVEKERDAPVRWVLEMQARHVGEHIADIRKIRQASQR